MDRVLSADNHGRPQKFFQGWQRQRFAYNFRLLTMQCKWTFTKHSPLSTRPVASF